ncbi:MAG: hypothetical protein STSR0001_06510 [Methanothrix sp.]
MSPFETLVQLINHMYLSLQMDFFNPGSRESAKFLISSGTFLDFIKKYTYVLSQIFIFVGYLAILLKKEKLKLSDDYSFLSTVNMGVLGLSIILPGMNAGFNFSRLYQITLILLSPFCIIGGKYLIESFFQFLCKDQFKYQKKLNIKDFSLKIICIFLILYFAVNTGLPNELLNLQPSSIPLSLHNMKSTDEWIAPSDAVYTYEQDVYGAKWLSLYKRRSSDSKVYADYISQEQVLMSYGSFPEHIAADRLYATTSSFPRDSYLYLRFTNVINNIVITQAPQRLAELDKFATKSYASVQDCIYNNGGNKIYYSW